MKLSALITRPIATTILSLTLLLTGTLTHAADVALFVGGEGVLSYLATGETYDAKQRKFVPTANDMSDSRFAPTATTLKSKEVLVVGGFNDTAATASADLYNPKTRLFAPTGNLNFARGSHTATLLNDGRVLVVGGFDNNFVSLASAEIYDPKTGQFTVTGSMAAPRGYHVAILLKDGRVLVAGGLSNSQDPSTTTAHTEIYDPRTAQFTAGNDMTTARASFAATRLANGKVLVTGGSDNTGTTLASAELFDPKSGAFTPTSGSLITARDQHASVMLKNSKVLVMGGRGSHESLSSAELYDPKTNSFSTTGSMTEPRVGFAIAPVTGGLLLGGNVDSTTDFYNTRKGLFSAGPLLFPNVGDERYCGAAASLTTPMSGIAPAC